MSPREVNAIAGRLSLRAPQHESLKQLAGAPAMLQHERDNAAVADARAQPDDLRQADHRLPAV